MVFLIGGSHTCNLVVVDLSHNIHKKKLRVLKFFKQEFLKILITIKFSLKTRWTEKVFMALMELCVEKSFILNVGVVCFDSSI